jgi:hypothetical protein
MYRFKWKYFHEVRCYLLGGGNVNSWAVTTRCTEREVACCVVWFGLCKNVEEVTPESFDTELFFNEIEYLPAILDPKSSSYNNKKPMRGRYCAYQLLKM